MLLPLRTDSPLRNTPYMNWALILANVAVFALQKARPEVTASFALYTHGPSVPAFVTYAFLHGSVIHLVGNMLFLYLFGNNVNDKMGHVGYLLFYLAGAMFSGIGYAVSSQAGALVGASGAVWAVTGAYLVLFPRANVSIIYFFIMVGHLELPSWIFVLIKVGMDIISLGAPSNVAHVAHLSGAVFGFAVSFALLAAHLLPRDQFDVWALFKQWNRRRQYRDMVAKGYNPFGYTPVAVSGDNLGGQGGAQAMAEPRDPRTERAVTLRNDIAAAITLHDLPRAAELYLELRGVDPQQVLSRQAQLDVANQLNAQQLYSEAAEAYEAFLGTYPKFEQIEHVELMLGLIYARYLHQYDRAKGYLVKAIARLHGDREITMARSELMRIEPLTARSGPAL